MLFEVVRLPNASGGAMFSAAEVGSWVEAPSSVASFEAVLSNTVTPAATIEIHGSNSNATTPGAGTLLGTITLSGANDIASFTKSAAAYKYKLAKVTALSGAGATVTVTMGA